MRKHLLTTLAIVIIIAVSNCIPVLANGQPQSNKNKVVSVPAGEKFPAIVTTPLSSKHLYAGQVVTMVLGENLYYNGKMIAPADSVLKGNVITVSAASKLKRGTLKIRFTNITTPFGIQIPISAIINTPDKKGEIVGIGTYEDESLDGNISIPINMPLELLLIQPITVNPELYNSNY